MKNTTFQTVRVCYRSCLFGHGVDFRLYIFSSTGHRKPDELPPVGSKHLVRVSNTRRPFKELSQEL